MNRLLILSCLFVLTTNQTRAQGKVEVRAGLTFPMGDFANDNLSNPLNNAGGAKTGISIGGMYIHPIPEKDFAVFLSTDFMYNSLSFDAEAILESNIRVDVGLATSNLEISYFNYINLPIITGVRYDYNFKDKAILFGDIGLGVNFLRVTDMNIIYGRNNDEANITYDPSTQFAFKLQGGVRLKDKYTVGLNYLNLGSHRIEGQATEDGDTQDSDDLKRRVAMVTLSFGYLF